jgi:UDP:flavonoid glycosyltransferase YjiC (YdhE family)
VSRRLLFTCWPFEGHVFPLLSIALAARERGAEVAFYTGPRLQPTVESQDVECFRFDRVQAVWERIHERERDVRGRRGSVRLQREVVRDWLVGSVPDQVADVRTLMSRWRPDVIVTDGSMWGPSLVLHEAAGIPVVFASTLLYSLVPGRDAPLPGSGLGPPRGAAGRAIAWSIARAVDVLARGPRRRLDEMRAANGLGPLGCPVNEWMGRLPLYLVGSVPELDFHRRDLPPGMHYVGPLLWHPPEPAGTRAWLDQIPSDRPWVHVTEGTSHHQAAVVLRAAANGLAGAPVEAILTCGRERDPSELGLARAANVHVTDWLSHGELLPRCAALVTTGGAQTIVSALAAGVPLVVVPTLWDKPANARRVAAAGVGVQVAPRDCTPKRLRDAVEEVLNEPSYGRTAARIAQRMRAAPGPAGAAELIGELVGAPTKLAVGGRPI